MSFFSSMVVIHFSRNPGERPSLELIRSVFGDVRKACRVELRRSMPVRLQRIVSLPVSEFDQSPKNHRSLNEISETGIRTAPNQHSGEMIR